MIFVLALVLLDAALIAPSHFVGVLPAFALALELPLILAVLWAVPQRARKGAAALSAAILLLAMLLRAANTATFVAFDRPFDIGADIVLAPAGWNWLLRSQGVLVATGAAVVVIAALAAIAVSVYMAMLRLARPPATRATSVAAALVFAVLLALAPAPWAGSGTVRVFADTARVATDGYRAITEFRAALNEDPDREIANARLYNALRGHDVLVVFAESYGRVAIDDPRYGAIGRQLDDFTAHLGAAGIGARSAWMTSSTFGGQSWLAHSTVMAGLRVNDQRRFVELIGSARPNMIQDFHRAGWRTAAVMPEITTDWPGGRYFAPDTIYNAPALGFRGTSFAYVTMPDQFTLSVLQAKELAPADRPPVMAMIALVSGHAPWTPLPRVIPWEKVGDGAVFNQAREGATPDEVWDNPVAIAPQYGHAMSYVLAALESYVLTYATDRTVIIVMGDHQPMALISGKGASREVPAHIIARDPAVLAALDDWHWTAGMRPDTTSPVWRMEAFRERLARTFSTGP